MNFLVETKTEYTIQLVNIITPYLLEGFKSIYDDAKKISKKGEELKVFQTCLRRIPSWTDEVVKLETKRILTDSNCGDILEDLLKAVIKSNIMILTNTPPDKKNKLKINYVIELEKFIHNSYIESAKNIFQNPFLFFHSCTPLELKRNEREAYDTIKNSIIDAIRKMLPINMILREYLGESFTDSLHNQNIDKLVSEQDKARLGHLLKSNDFNDEIKYQLVKKNNDQTAIVLKQNQNQTQTKDQKDDQIPVPVQAPMKGGNNESTSSDEENSDASQERTEKTDTKINTMEREKQKMPTQYGRGKERDLDIMSASESYIPKNNNKMDIFESYKMAANKHANLNVSKETQNIKKGGSTKDKHPTETEASNSVSISVTEKGKGKTNTVNQTDNKKKYIDRDFKFNF